MINYKERYARHTGLPGLDKDGQKRLARGKALILGLGGGGAVAAVTMAAAGIKCLGLVEYDIIEESNLHRQLFYTEQDIGAPKLKVLAEYIQHQNSGVKLDCYDQAANAELLQKIVPEYDVIVLAADDRSFSFKTAEVCLNYGKSMIFGGALDYRGMVGVQSADGGACLGCVFPQEKPDIKFSVFTPCPAL